MDCIARPWSSGICEDAKALALLHRGKLILHSLYTKCFSCRTYVYDMEAEVHQLNKVTLEKGKLLMSEQQVQPDGNVCTEDKIISDEKQQLDNDLSQKDKLILKLEMQLDTERQHTREYRLKYTMTTKVSFACTE
jgi:hypothetical protein